MSDTESVTVADAPEAIHNLPPSCKLVWLVLANEGEFTQEDLIEETRLSNRTVRWAGNRLSEFDLISPRPSTQDTRQKLYSTTNF